MFFSAQIKIPSKTLIFLRNPKIFYTWHPFFMQKKVQLRKVFACHEKLDGFKKT